MLWNPTFLIIMLDFELGTPSWWSLCKYSKIWDTPRIWNTAGSKHSDKGFSTCVHFRQVCLMISGTDLSFSKKTLCLFFSFCGERREWPGKGGKPFRHQLVSLCGMRRSPSTWSGGRGRRWSACRGHALQPPLRSTHRSPKGPDNSPKSRWKRNDKLPASIKEVKYKNDHFYLSFENYIESNMPCCGMEIQNTHLSRCLIPKKHFVCGLKIPHTPRWRAILATLTAEQLTDAGQAAAGLLLLGLLVDRDLPSTSTSQDSKDYHKPLDLSAIRDTTSLSKTSWSIYACPSCPPLKHTSLPDLHLSSEQVAQNSPASSRALAFLTNTESLSQTALLLKSVDGLFNSSY